MGIWRRTWERFNTFPTGQFHVDGPIIDRLVVALMNGVDSGAARVGREEALSVPAVLRGRNLICSIATLPLVQLNPDRKVTRLPLLEQIDPNVPNVVTLGQTVEDLLFEGVSWWRILGFAADGYPTSAEHIDVGRVSLNPPTGTPPPTLPSGLATHGQVWIDGQPIPADRVIKFDSPNPPLLRHGGRAIRRAILLDQAARMYADDPRPLDYFTPAEGADPAGDNVIQEFVDEWVRTRGRRGTAYVPAALKYNSVDTPTPADLQLVELQKRVTLDLANAIGLDPEDLGVSTTSRTYQNATDRRQDRINDVLSPYMRAITDRLSMGDVTRRGYRVVFDLDDYMKADPRTRWDVYRTGVEIGAIDVDEIREEEKLPERAVRPAAPVTPIRPAAAVASAPAAHQFDGAPHQFADVPVVGFSVDVERRTIRGRAVPYGEVAQKFMRRFRFEPGALRWSDIGRVKLLRDHDYSQAIGRAVELTDAPDGFDVVFRVARGPEGDRALALAEDGVLDGLSVGVDFDLSTDTVPDPSNKGVTLVRRADLREVSLTAMPAFDSARVTRVAASRTEGDTVPETTTEPTTAPAAPAVVPAGGLTLSGDQFEQLIQRVAPAAQPAEEGRQTVTPVRLAASVTDPQSYRFDRQGSLHPAAHDFGLDFVRAVKAGDLTGETTPEGRRVVEFVKAQFTVETGDVNELNPTINLPRYIDQREYKYPVWSAVNRGAPPNGVQPFTWPSFSSASGLVAAHTEGVEPTSGNLTTTSQTVTPTAVSGKASITRETWDMGGMPGIGNLIWQQMLRGWFEALEARVVAVLDAASPTALGTFTAGGGTTGQTLASEMRDALARLHFVRGGFRFDTAFAQVDLYTELAGALDDAGRPLFPAIGPSNADGTVSNRYQSINVNGVPFLPTWALAASGTVAASSYLIDRLAVDGWATAPQRLTLDQTEVAYVHIGIWGYGAAAINDINGVREISYDPAA